MFGRSSTVGTQQFPVNWGGDNCASYVSMAESLRGGLSFCQSGFGFWAHDMSGFKGKATPDLYKRWAAFGMLSTHSRLHGMTSFRMPWCFDDECVEVLGRFTRLKCSLMPYLYESAVNVHRTGEPMMRAMMLDFPGETACLFLDRQYMLGERLLVAPVFSEDGSVEFYVPEGCWTDYLTGELYEGGRYYTRSYDYDHLPLLVRPNSIIARGAREDRADYDYAEGATYEVFALDGRAECRVYDAEAQERAHAVAERSGDEIRFAMDAKGGAAWKLLLNGVHAASAIEGGSAADGERGLLVTPDAGAREVVVKL